MKPLSSKQIDIIAVLCKGNPDGTFCDIDQLLKRLTYKTTKQSLQFSIRALIGRGLIEKKDCETRRRQSRRVLAPTIRGYEAHKIARATAPVVAS